MTSGPEPPGGSSRATPWPTASVVVPTFRRPGPLRRCLDSLAKLDYPTARLEIVIVDDGGQDLSLAELRAIAPELAVHWVTQVPNGGPAKARNLGARRASGELLAFTDDDCRPQPAWLQDLVHYLIGYFPKARSLRPFFTSNNMACRREAFLRVGGFDETFRFSAGEDRDLSERWAAEVGPLQHLNGAVVDHYHELTLRRFVRQHHYYGRGAVHLARRRRGQERPRPEPLGFYSGMLADPIRRHGWRHGSPIAALMGLSQVASLTGMCTELLWPSLDDGSRSPPD